MSLESELNYLLERLEALAKKLDAAVGKFPPGGVVRVADEVACTFYGIERVKFEFDPAHQLAAQGTIRLTLYHRDPGHTRSFQFAAADISEAKRAVQTNWGIDSGGTTRRQ